MTDLKSWYLSKTVWGGVVAILACCGNLLGLDIGAEAQRDLIDGLTALAGAIGGLVAVYGRIAASKKLR